MQSISEEIMSDDVRQITYYVIGKNGQWYGGRDSFTTFSVPLWGTSDEWMMMDCQKTAKAIANEFGGNVYAMTTLFRDGDKYDLEKPHAFCIPEI
jgi:hypothetical protein